MARSHPAVEASTYAAARMASLLLSMFPVNANLQTARLIGSAMWMVDARHRKRGMENIAASFPELSEAQVAAIAKRSMQHFMELAMDVLFTTRLVNINSWHQYIHLDNLAQSLRILLRGRGAILITGHYGNWEVLGYSLATLGFETYSIARPIDNPYIDTWLLGVREKKGQIILSKRGITTTAQQVLERHGVLAIIADQDAGKKGMFVPFFGRLASTYKSIGLLAMQHQVPVIIGCARRRGDRFSFDMSVNDIIYPEDWRKQDDELRYITRRYTRAMENFIRVDPTQYLWIHRRWKSRPRDEMEAHDAGQG